MSALRNVEILGASGRQDIVVDGETIQEIRARQTVPDRSATISFAESVLAFPGLINSHDHLEFDCYNQLGGGPYRDYVEWAVDIRRRRATTFSWVESVPQAMRVNLGLARNLLCGVTSVVQHGSEGRGLIKNTRIIHSPRLGRFRHMLIPDRRTIVVHVGEGINRESELEIDTLIRWNVWQKPLIGVHAIAMRPDQASRFAAVVWCPESNDFLFGKTAAISELKRRTTILFGTDSTLTASWNIWSHLRRARQIGELTDNELIAALTTNAARVWNFPFHGRLAAGAAADLVIARKKRDDPYDAFFAIEPEDILLVMRAGKIELIDESLRAQLPEKPKLYPVEVNGASKYSSENYRELAASLRTLLPSLPVPIR